MAGMVGEGEALALQIAEAGEWDRCADAVVGFAVGARFAPNFTAVGAETKIHRRGTGVVWNAFEADAVPDPGEDGLFIEISAETDVALGAAHANAEVGAELGGFFEVGFEGPGGSGGGAVEALDAILFGVETMEGDEERGRIFGTRGRGQPGGGGDGAPREEDAAAQGAEVSGNGRRIAASVEGKDADAGRAEGFGKGQRFTERDEFGAIG